MTLSDEEPSSEEWALALGEAERGKKDCRVICCRKRKKAAGQLNPQQKPGKHETVVDDPTRLALREWMVGMSHVIRLTRVKATAHSKTPIPRDSRHAHCDQQTLFLDRDQMGQKLETGTLRDQRRKQLDALQLPQMDHSEIPPQLERIGTVGTAAGAGRHVAEGTADTAEEGRLVAEDALEVRVAVDNPFVPFVELEHLDLQLKTFLVLAFHVQAFHEPAEELHVLVVRIQQSVVEGIRGRRAVE